MRALWSLQSVVGFSQLLLTSCDRGTCVRGGDLCRVARGKWERGCLCFEKVQRSCSARGLEFARVETNLEVE